MLRLFKDKIPNKNINIKPVKAKIKINRTLSTEYKKLNDIIWNKSLYKNSDNRTVDKRNLSLLRNK